MTVGKFFFQILQLIHHMGIANRQTAGDLPQAFERKVKNPNKFLKPTLPRDQVRAESVNASTSWTDNIG